MEFINLIRISERTGDIELALNTICQQLEAQIELKQKVQQALSYPLITLGSSIALVVMMIIWVVPVFSDVFGHFQAELPPATKMLIEISSSIHAYFLEILIGLMTVMSSLILVWIRSSALQRMADRWSFRLPLLGKLFRLATLTHWCRTLAHLLDCGLALPDALRLTAQSSNHWLSHDLTAEVFKHIAQSHEYIRGQVAPNKRNIWAFVFDIFHYIYDPQCWTKSLQGKRLLIISPFVENPKLEA